MPCLNTKRFLFVSIAILFLGTFCLKLTQTTGSPKSVDSKEAKPPAPQSDLPAFSDLWNAYPKNGEGPIVLGPGNTYSMGILRKDHRVSDIVAYVDVVEAKLTDRTEGSDCENERGYGYCAYTLTAKVLEIYKGKIDQPTLEFVEISEAFYPKRAFIGKKLIFLTWNDHGSKKTFGTIENSTRRIEYEVLAKMRSIVDPNAPVDENDQEEPYSKASIRDSFKNSDVVAYVDVLRFRPDKDDVGGEGSILTAVVKEVFKGSLRVGQKLEYRQDLIYRKHRAEDLGRQVVYLSVPNDNRYKQMKYDKVTGKPYFEPIELKEKNVRYASSGYDEGFIKHNILEKLREITGKSPTKK